MRYSIKALNLGGILDHAVMLLRNHFKMLLTITLFIYIPALLVAGYLNYMLMPVMPPPTGGQMPEINPGYFLVIAVWGVLFAFLITPITNAAVIRAVADEYLGKPASAQSSLRHALKVFLPLIFTTIIAWIFITIGLILLIIPGIWLMFRYWFTSHVVVIEGIKGRAALKRSKTLMKGNMGTAFVLGLLLGIIGFAMGMVSAFVPVQAIAVLVQVLIQAGAFIFGAAASVVFYFSCRCKLENFDLAVLAEAMAKEDAGGATEAGLSVETVE